MVLTGSGQGALNKNVNATILDKTVKKLTLRSVFLLVNDVIDRI